ncbi:hypothetical protein MAFF211491_11790 [Ralstonia solanacearum]|nr:hypothetical protein MAFF211491_02740 [Ralstonia solanacearum]BCL96727.1 hypothetical protein MAFF211491_11790 [Ralstonia solanacearum]BCM11084.1 hypothetical protein MAFF241648_02740 [Ralstonia solanacearum]BCM12040.1 hypothetical protein MAFF241648_12300 [Ralstonia solanacearum]BCN08288.1 hypothetical protein RPSD_01730 [Ralstonia solanacearum]
MNGPPVAVFPSVSTTHAYNMRCGPGGAAFGLAGRRVPVCHPRRLARPAYVTMSGGPPPNTEPAMPNISACVKQALSPPPPAIHRPLHDVVVSRMEIKGA